MMAESTESRRFGGQFAGLRQYAGFLPKCFTRTLFAKLGLPDNLCPG